MEILIEQIKNINKLSKGILFELNKNNPSFDNIREIMIQRQEFINKFGTDLNKDSINKMSERKKDTIKSFFDEFLIINENIKDVISDVLNDHKKRLSAAKKTAKSRGRIQ
jgi:ATP-dependent protease Clp ATPase subunit